MSEDSGSVSSDSMELPPAAVNELNLHNNGPLSFQNGFRESSEPSVDIVEEPQQRGFRFRYRCEGPSHGGLQGENSMRGNKTYPTVKISNHSGPAVVMVTLVTDEKIPRTHAHELMGKHCQSGICVVEARESSGPDCIVTFPNLGILHVTKKKVEAILKDRIAESLRRDRHLMTSNYTTALPELTDDLREKAGKQAKEDAKKMVLNVVRLSFQVYLQDANGNFSRQMERVISKPIYDSKCPGVAGLNICRMDRNAGCSTGYEEVFLLCDKVQKDDILVRFYEKDEDDHVKWEAFGNFGPSDVHRQYAIVFKTPPYRDLAITAPVQVMVQLRRISDHETSEPKPFTYFPQQIDKDEVGKKRKKTLPFDTRRYRDNHFQNGQHGSGGSGVSFCSGGLGGSAGSIPIPNLNNNTSTTNSGGRVQNYPFVHGDMVACASGPRMEMQPADPQMAAPARGLTMNACMPQLSQHMPMSLGNDQMFPKPQLANTQMDLLANQSQTMKPIEIAPDTTEATTFAELKSFLETCGAEVLLTPTTPLNVTTMNEPLLGHQQQQIYRQSQMQQQQQQQQQQQKQFMQQQQQQQQQLQQAFPQMAQMAPMTQQTMQTAAMQQNFSTNLGQIPPPPQYSQGPQQPPAYSPAQGQYSPASQAAYSPASQQTYSPASQQTYSPVPPQAFSPGAQQAVSPGAQQAYSPGSAHSFSPGAQQQQQQQQFPPLTQPPQYSPNSQHQYPSPPHQHSPPTSGPYLFTGHDLVMDGGGDVETDSPSNNTGGDDTDDVEDLMCDSAAFVDDDLQEDAVPMSPREAKAFSERFHKEHESTRNEDELLINDLEKLSLGKTEKSVNNGHEEHPAFTKEKKESSPKHGKENTESDELAVTIPSNDPKQSLLDLQLATNVAKRSLVALHNFTKTRNPAYLVLCQRHLMSVQDDLGDTALHMAIIHRQTDVAYQLLQAMASLGPSACDIVNTCNILRQTPLQLAVMTAQAHLIRPLLAQKADCHLVDKDGNTPLHLAARLGFPECLVELLSCNLNTNQRQLDALNFDGFSALHLAIHLGHLEAMKVLLERGADINQRDGRSGRTALHHAVEANNHTMAGYILLKPDVDVNASAYDRNTALHMAVGRRLYDMAKLLIGYEANPEAESSEFISSEYEDDIVEDSDDLTEDGEDESEDSEERGYVRPIDMAQGDEKMLRILNHDDLDSGFEDGTKLKSTDSDEGDVSRLDPATLEALAEKLDTVTSQAGWRDLAKALGLMSAMDRFRDEPSPTRHILDTYKSEKGTLRELRKVFNDMERYDAAALVDKFLTTQHETELRPEIQDLNKLHQAGSDVDQGYTSSSLGSS